MEDICTGAKRHVFEAKVGLTIAILMSSGCVEQSGRLEDPAGDDAELLENLMLFGFAEEDIELQEDGGAVAEDDVFVTLETSRAMIGGGESGGYDRQTVSLVTVDRAIGTICIDGTQLYGTSSPFSARALEGAIHRFNDLGLVFEMKQYPSECDQVHTTISWVEDQHSLHQGWLGMAELPNYSGWDKKKGRPGYFVHLAETTKGYPEARLRSLIMHELGHVVGLMHTNSLAHPLFGEDVPGAPVYDLGADHHADHLSVMWRSLQWGATGEWSEYDKVALEYLYGGDAGEPDPEPPFHVMEGKYYDDEGNLLYIYQWLGWLEYGNWSLQSPGRWKMYWEDSKYKTRDIYSDREDELTIEANSGSNVTCVRVGGKTWGRYGHSC